MRQARGTWLALMQAMHGKPSTLVFAIVAVVALGSAILTKAERRDVAELRVATARSAGAGARGAMATRRL